MLRTASRLAAALALVGVATIGAGSRPAQAAPTHVAVVVANVGSACVPWHSGMTGADVLGANFAVTYGQAPPYAGFVLKINGVGTVPPTLTEYWAYFHNSGGGWVYSGSGAASYHPQPGTVEGWAWDPGQSPAPQPPATSYASICGGQDPAPAPTRAPNPPRVHHPSPTPPAQPGLPAQPGQPIPPARGAQHPGAAAHASAASASSHAGSSRAAGHHGTTASSMSSAGTATTAAVAPSTAATLPPARPAARRESASALPTVSTALALVAAASIGGSAFWRLRRRKQGW